MPLHSKGLNTHYRILPYGGLCCKTSLLSTFGLYLEHRSCQKLTVVVVTCQQIHLVNATGTTDSTENTYGSLVNVTCKHGYKIAGRQSLVVNCTASGKWTLEPVSCGRKSRIDVTSYSLMNCSLMDSDSRARSRVFVGAARRLVDLKLVSSKFMFEVYKIISFLFTITTLRRFVGRIYVFFAILYSRRKAISSRPAHLYSTPH